MILGLKEYIKNTKEIRSLSSPSLETIGSPEEYESLLRSNFEKIGKLAEENKGLLGDFFRRDPKDGFIFESEDIMSVISLFFGVVNDGEVENLDLSLSNRISTHLWEVERENVSTDVSVFIADMHAVSCYLMMGCTYRTYPFSKACEDFCRKGKEACDYLVSFLEPEKWKTLKDENARKTVLRRAFYKHLFYMEEGMDFSRNEEILEILRRAKSIENENLYRDTFTDDEWIMYKVGLREGIGSLLESANKRGFAHVQCCEIKDGMDELMSLWRENPEICMETTSYSLNLLYYYRACYFTGDLKGKEYKEKLLEIYKTRSTKRFGRADVILNLLLPVEYVAYMKKRRAVEGDLATLEQFYRNAINYVFQCPNSGTIVYILNYLLQLLFYFKEVPGGTTFEEVGLDCLAALHPPTYVHSKMVANLTRCLCKHMFRLHPERFLNFTGAKDLESVEEYRDRVLDYAYHSALCHDFGKIAVMDTVFTYGRAISDAEFDQIKAHSQIGEKLLSQNTSTQRYKNIALGHHRWFDLNGGYPANNGSSPVKEGIIIDLVTCADCMDAATDIAGRSYSKGKSLDDFIEEVKAEIGSRYALFLSDLLDNEEVRKDLEFLLTKVRSILYRDTFVMLNRLQRLGGDSFGLFDA